MIVPIINTMLPNTLGVFAIFLKPKKIPVIKKTIYIHTNNLPAMYGDVLNILNIYPDKKGHTGASIKNPRDKSTFLYFLSMSNSNIVKITCKQKPEYKLGFFAVHI